MTTVHNNPPVRHADPHVQAGLATRRFGYAVAVAVNAVMLYLVNRSPGWEALPFLTPETTEVLGIVNASIAAGIVANLVYLAWDPAWVRALGDVATTSIGLTALVQIWRVWPVELDPGWNLVARWVIGIGIVGSVIGIIGALVRLGRSLSASPSWPDDQPPGSGTTHHA